MMKEPKIDLKNYMNDKANFTIHIPAESNPLYEINAPKIQAVIKFKKLSPDASAPHYFLDGDLGMDVTSVSIEYDEVNDRYIYHTGIACETAREIGCLMLARSCTTKTEYYIPNGLGLIDTFLYRGELCIIFKNRTCIVDLATREGMLAYIKLPWYKRLFTNVNKMIQKEMDFQIEWAKQHPPFPLGAACAQLVFYTKVEGKMEEVKELSETERGTGGFGHSDKIFDK